MARNLVVIVADTLRHPQFMGAPAEAAAPFLSRWTRQGTSIPRLLASSSWTCPSHVSLLAGVDPWQTHFYVAQAQSAIPPSRSLADLWREGGGESAAFSENFLVAPELGTAPGYDSYNPGLWSRLAGYAQRGVTVLGYEQLLHRTMEPLIGRGGDAPQAAKGLRGTGTAVYRLINSMRSGVELNRAVARYLRRRPPGRPLHLFVNLAEPHEPYLLPTPALRGHSLGHLPSVNLARHTDYLGRSNAGDAFRLAYLASVGELDRQLEVLIATLRRHDLLRDALVLFVSDHGQALGENGFYGHGHYLHDELVMIPGVLWSYRNGTPVDGPSPRSDWVDLRHLYDLLLDDLRGEDGPLGPRIERSRAIRGPAASYWEGPFPRAPGGFLTGTRRSEIYRELRLVQADATATVRDTTSAVESIPTPGHAPGPEEMVEVARRIVVLGRGDRSPAPDVAGMSRDVDQRLRSWGYD